MVVILFLASFAGYEWSAVAFGPSIATTPTVRIASLARTQDGIRVVVDTNGVPSGTTVDFNGSLAQYGVYGQFYVSGSCTVGSSGACRGWLPATYSSWGFGRANSRIPNSSPEMVYAQAWGVNYGIPPFLGGVSNPSAKRLAKPVT